MVAIWTTVSVLVVIATNSVAQSFTCGIPTQKVNRLIVRGQTTDPSDWPWHAVILHKKTKKAPPIYACGGTLIHIHYIITAKHCILKKGTHYPMSTRAIVVQLGVEEMYYPTPNVQQHEVFHIHIIKNEAWSDLRNDKAILELETSVQFNDFVLPACLLDRRVNPEEVGTTIGFGLTETDELSSVLKKVDMPVIDSGKCVRVDRAGYGGTIDEGLFCAGFLNGTTVCNGDSGGGFFLKEGDAWHIVGIVAFSIGRENYDHLCRHDAYGVFTRIQKYTEWIRDVSGLVCKKF